MQRLFLILQIVVGLLLISFCSGCSKQLAEYNYKITVEVEAPAGLVSGSAVRNITVRKGSDNNLPEARGMQRDLVGEAVAVELPNGEMLFSLISENSKFTGELNLPILPKPKSRGRIDHYQHQLNIMMADKEKVSEIPRLSPSSINKSRSIFPQLVRFTDMADPKSLELIDPANLAGTFGDGYSLKRITIQITDDPVTVGISKKLKWLDHLEDYRTDSQNPFTSTLPPEIGGLRRL